MLWKRVLFYGLGIWSSLVVISAVLFSLEKPDPALFESIKFIGLSGVITVFTALYIKQAKKIGVGAGICLGLSWMSMTILLDLMLYAFGLFNLPLTDYFKDVASSYLVMPLTGGIMAAFLQGKPKS